MTCVNCGRFNGPTSQYCSSCGIILTPQTPRTEHGFTNVYVLALAIIVAFFGTWLVFRIDTNLSTKIARGSYVPEIGPFMISSVLEEHLEQVQWTANQVSDSHYSTEPVRVWVRGRIPGTQDVLTFSFYSRPKDRTLEIVALEWGNRPVPLWEIRSILSQMVRKEWNSRD
ncbi:MAG: hypothetical protein GW949_08170 [Spirochaetales bacterium]|nr:hypothetical protein [Spirochaetales bacterium]